MTQPVRLRRDAHCTALPNGRYGIHGFAVEEIPSSDRVTALGARSSDVVLEAGSLYRVYTGCGFPGVTHPTQLHIHLLLDLFMAGLRLIYTDITQYGEIVLYISAARNVPFNPLEPLADALVASQPAAAPAATAPAPAPRAVPAAPAPVAPPDASLTDVAPPPAPVAAPVRPVQAFRPPAPVLTPPPVAGGFIPEGPTKLAELPPRAPAQGQAGPLSDAEAARRVEQWLAEPDNRGKVVGADDATGIAVPADAARLISPAATSGGGFAVSLDSHPKAPMKC